jgi:hypothetical protein
MLAVAALYAGTWAEEPAPPAATPPPAATAPKARCEQMMQKRHEALATLEAKTTAMNAAQGSEKVDAIAAVVSELVAQHRAMHGGEGGPEDCPMMGGKQMPEMQHGQPAP